MSDPLPAFYTPPDGLGASDDERYISVEEVAERLGISTGILMRRVEAGDIPARRVRTDQGFRYELLLSDLGLDLDELGPAPADAAPAPAPAPPPPPEPASPLAYSAPSPPSPAGEAAPSPPAAPAGWHAPVPAEPEPPVAPQPPPDPRPEPAAPASRPLVADVTVVHRDGNGVMAEVPPMSIDPRLLVAGLLDRWERSLEDRIQAEQTQRFESELANRQALVRELQMELQSARAEQAAALAEKDRAIAQHERLLADRDRELAELREASATRKRGRFFNR